MVHFETRSGIVAESARLHEEIERLLEPGLPALALESCELTNTDPELPGWVDPLPEHGRSIDHVLTREMNATTCTGGSYLAATSNARAVLCVWETSVRCPVSREEYYPVVTARLM